MGDKSTKRSLDVKRKIQTTDMELHRLNEVQWSYSKRMLKFDMASWVFGMSSFVSTITITNLRLLGTTLATWAPLLIVALAVPIALTALLARKFAVKIKQLEAIRRKLLAEYEKAMLTRVGEMIVAK